MALCTLDDDVKNQQRQSIASTLDQEALCDVTFRIGPEQTEFRANRIFLAAISDVFKAMLFGSMEEGKPHSIVTIPDIDAKAFGAVLDFSYCKDPRMSIENVVPIAFVAQKYQINTLLPLCTKYFKSCIKRSTVCPLLNDAVNLHLTDLVSDCLSAIRKSLGFYAKEIIESADFLDLSLSAMIVFLQIDHLHIKEEELWEAVLKWIDHQESSKSSEAVVPFSKRRKLNDGSVDHKEAEFEAEVEKCNLLSSVSPHIRFALMDGKYFVKKVQPKGCLNKDEILEISNYILCGGRETECGSFSVKKREFDNIIKIQRGNIKLVTNATAGWARNAICIRVDRDAKLIGIGVLVQGSIKIEELKADRSLKGRMRQRSLSYSSSSRYTPPDSLKRSKTTLFSRIHETVKVTAPSPNPFRLDIKPHILMQRGREYQVNITVPVSYMSHGFSYTVSEGKSTVTQSGLTVTFSNAPNSTTHTNITSGMFPVFYFMNDGA